MEDFQKEIQEASELRKANIFSNFSNSEDLIKGKGEGSKGGKVIGHTKSGKPIYAKHDDSRHSDFDSNDHIDALTVHRKLKLENTTGKSTGKTISGDTIYSNKKWSDHHYHESMHGQKANVDINSKNKKAIQKVTEHASKDRMSIGNKIHATAGGFIVRKNSNVDVYDKEGNHKDTHPSSYWSPTNSHSDMHKHVGTIESKKKDEIKKDMSAGAVTGTDTTNQPSSGASVKQESLFGVKKKKPKY